jgi:putative two-component system response regulator
MDGYETIKALKNNPATAGIPVIFLTAKNDPFSELEGLKLGAIDYIAKPFVDELLNKRVELHLTMERQQRRLKEQDDELREQSNELKNFNENLQEMVAQKTKNVFHLQISILQTVADLVERRDGNTGGHIARTQRYLRLLLTALIDSGLYREQIDENWDIDLVILSSQLHDVGKIGIDDSILRKSGPLSEDEFNEIKKHTVYGAEIIDRMMDTAVENDFLRYAKVFAETHQEKWDGTGYPHGLKGQNIPLLGRLMAIADVYDALVSERTYKKPFTHEEAVHIIIEEKGKHFDPILVDVFERITDQFRDVANNYPRF